MRAVGYHEAWGGPLDRRRLDHIAPGALVRVQHRSGHAWVLSSAACRAVGWLAARLPDPPPVDLSPCGRRLAGRGVTGVTDATPYDAPGGFGALADAVRRADLPVHLVATGAASLAEVAPPPPLTVGSVKVMVPDGGPGLDVDAIAAAIATAHRAGRPTMLHCVTTVALAVAVAAWSEAGSTPGDRVEHASVLPPGLADEAARLGLTVVTQPGFVAERGDHYLAHVEADDQPWLYRCGSLPEAGVPVAAGTDAPFGPADPWVVVRAAVDRRTASGSRLGPGEAMTPAAALGLFTGAARDSGGPSRTITVGAPADLLDCDLATALADLDAVHVALTIRAGEITHEG